MTPERDAELRAVVDRQLELERKAAAWDALYALVGRGYRPDCIEDLDAVERRVHPAPESPVMRTPNETQGYARWADGSWREQATREYNDELRRKREADYAAWCKAHPLKALLARVRAWWPRA